jgi:hypothetical protein
MSLLNLLTFGIFGGDYGSTEIDDLKKQLKTCKESKKIYKDRCKKYEYILCNNVMVPVYDKFYVYDTRGKFNLFELDNGKFVNVTLDPLPCPYNGGKKGFWNCIYYEDDGVYCLTAGTVDDMDNTNLVSNPPHQGDYVSMKFKVYGKRSCKFQFRYKVLASELNPNGKFRILVNDKEEFSTSDTSSADETKGWKKVSLDVKCYDTVELVYHRNGECIDIDEQVFLKDLCLYGGYMKAVQQKSKKEHGKYYYYGDYEESKKSNHYPYNHEKKYFEDHEEPKKSNHYPYNHDKKYFKDHNDNEDYWDDNYDDYLG